MVLNSSGRWPHCLNHSPTEVTVFHEGRYRVFRRAFFAWPQRSIALQYREVSCPESWHLYVFDNCTYRVDHRDQANPDPPCGRGVEHFVKDVPNAGAWAALAVLVVAGVAAAAMSS